MPQSLSNTSYNPPSPGTKLDDPAWSDWFYKLWGMVGKDGGEFPKIKLVGDYGTTTLTPDNANYNLGITADSGYYVLYQSSNQNILYGFATNVTRSGGTGYVVGAQLNAYAAAGVTGTGVYGVALQAVNWPQASNFLVGSESSVVNMRNNCQQTKVGVDVVFKNRLDGITTTPEGLGANQYNYWATGITFNSQARSTAGEYCGWNTGIDFIENSLDACIPPQWNATTYYPAGQIVYYAALNSQFKAILPNTNQNPSTSPTYWVTHGGGAIQYAIGIDFSSLSQTTIARMANAIRLRDTMSIAWTTDGGISSSFVQPAARLRLMDNPSGGTFFEIDAATGFGYNQIGRVF
jgi:hypothetical protein